MNSLIEGICSIANSAYKSRPVIIDNFVFRLHYRLSTAFLISCAILVTSKQLFGDPIKCSLMSKKKISGEMLDTFCWVHTTFSVSTAWKLIVGDQVVYPGVTNSQDRGDIVHHLYYQWVGLVLFIQGVFFYLPHYLWKSSYGRKIVDVVPETLRGGVVEEKVRRDAIVQLAHRLIRNSGRSISIRCFYVLTAALNVANVMMQLYLMDRFLGGNFLDYGRSILHFTDWGYSSHYDAMLKIFPRMTKCVFYSYGDSGDVAKDDALCILPINVVNEKIYLVLWFWFYILLIITSLTLMYQMVFSLFPQLTVRYLRSRCSSQYAEAIESVSQYFSSGDLFLIAFIRRNINRGDFEDLMNELQLQVHVLSTWSSAVAAIGPPEKNNDADNVGWDRVNGYVQTPV